MEPYPHLPLVAVLFAMQKSHYKTLPGLDVFDIDRDARTYAGELPVVAHPPCRAWSRMRHFAKPRPDEKALALFAIEAVRRCGGVLEHPSGSALWAAAGLPKPGSTDRDSFGGWTLPVSQKWWGHRAEKRTWLYIVGCAPGSIPDFPIVLGEAERTCGLFSGRDKANCRKKVSKAEHMATPPEFAAWLIDLATRCRVGAAA